VDAPDRTATLCELYEVLFETGMNSPLTVPDFCPTPTPADPLAIAYINVDGEGGREITECNSQLFPFFRSPQQVTTHDKYTRGIARII